MGKLLMNHQRKRGRVKRCMVSMSFYISVHIELFPPGVDKEVWNRARKGSPAALAALNGANSVLDYTQREAIYDVHRDDLTAQFK